MVDSKISEGTSGPSCYHPRGRILVHICMPLGFECLDSEHWPGLRSLNHMAQARCSSLINNLYAGLYGLPRYFRDGGSDTVDDIDMWKSNRMTSEMKNGNFVSKFAFCVFGQYDFLGIGGPVSQFVKEYHHLCGRSGNWINSVASADAGELHFVNDGFRGHRMQWGLQWHRYDGIRVAWHWSKMIVVVIFNVGLKLFVSNRSRGTPQDHWLKGT